MTSYHQRILTHDIFRNYDIRNDVKSSNTNSMNMNMKISCIICLLTSIFLECKCQRRFAKADIKRMQYQVAEFKMSYYVSIEDDFIISCDIVKIKESDQSITTKKWNKETKEKLEIEWFRWEDPNDLSFQLNKEEECTRYL